jgi:hypothetical protein
MNTLWVSWSSALAVLRNTCIASHSTDHRVCALIIQTAEHTAWRIGAVFKLFEGNRIPSINTAYEIKPSLYSSTLPILRHFSEWEDPEMAARNMRRGQKCVRLSILYKHRALSETDGGGGTKLVKRCDSDLVKVKVKLSLCFNWASRYEGVLGELRYSYTHSLTSALDGGEWSASRPGRFTPRERVPGTHWLGGWVGPRAVLDAVLKRKIPSLRRESNRRIPIVQRYTDWRSRKRWQKIWA